MANLNSVHMIGRLTRDPEFRDVPTCRIVALGFAVNNRRKNQQSGQWEDEPVFLDCEAFGKTADAMDGRLHKGSQIFIDGHLKLDQWTDKNTNEKRSKLKVVVDSFQFLDGKQAQGDRQSEPDRQPVAVEKPSDVPEEPIPF